MDSDLAHSLLERLGIPDEQRGDLAERLARRLSDPVIASVATAVLSRPAPAPDRAGRTLHRARAVIDGLERQLDAAEEVLGRVAERLGACPACLGERRRCPSCRGSGRPGTGEPHAEELVRWLAPALARLGLQIVNEGAPPARGETKESGA